MSETFYSQFSSKNPSAPAFFVPGGPELTYGELFAAIRDFQSKIARLDIARQQAISIALPNTLEYCVSFLGVAFSGLIASPLNSNYKESEFDFYLRDVNSKLMIVPRGASKDNYAAVVAAKKLDIPVVEVAWGPNGLEVDGLPEEFYSAQGDLPLLAAPQETAFVLHTSGTTGRPKAVPLTHRNMATTVHNIISTYKLNPFDRSYLVMPLFHVHGLLCGFLAPLGSGGSVVVPLKFSASHFWKDFTKYKANWYTAVPTIHQILLKSEKPSPIPEIRFIRSCSSSLAPTTFHDLEKTFNAPVLEAYAMTEACHQMTSNNLPPGKRKPGTVGVGQGVEVVILDPKDNVLPLGQEGEISIKGANVTPGYINNPKANAESFTKNGYFRTGDQGRKDEDGFVVITGRIKELINRGGEKISPVELDGLLLSFPGASEAVVFGAADELYGQQVQAAMVLKPDHKGKVKYEDVIEFLKPKVAKFKLPTKIYFVDSIPKTATGKIQRRIVAAAFEPKKAKL